MINNIFIVLELFIFVFKKKWLTENYDWLTELWLIMTDWTRTQTEPEVFDTLLFLKV